MGSYIRTYVQVHLRKSGVEVLFQQKECTCIRVCVCMYLYVDERMCVPMYVYLICMILPTVL